MRKKIAALLMAGLMVANSTVPVFADELSVTDGSGQSSTTVTGSISAVTTMDVTIPIGGINFAIDSDSQITAQGIVIESNTAVPLTVNVLSVTPLNEGDETNGLTATTTDAPEIVPVDTYTAEQWDNLTKAKTFEKIALAIKQVDVVDDGGSDVAGTALTAATTDQLKVTTPVELGDLASNNKLAHMESGYDGGSKIGVNIETSTDYTNYGKAWLSENTIVFRYTTTFEFAYDEEATYTVSFVVEPLSASGEYYTFDIESQSIASGGVATNPGNSPQPNSHPSLPAMTSFDGWFTDDTYSTPFDFNSTVITEDTTIYGKYTYNGF